VLLIKPTIKCNNHCSYCYEDPFRGKSLPEKPYNIDKILDVITKSKYHDMCLHGGEPTLLPLSDFEILLKAIFEKLGKSAIQTNGLLVNESHIELFKKYKTSIGLSIDGDGELNSARSSIEETNKLFSLIQTLQNEKISVSVISVINKRNGSRDKIPKLLDFITRASEIGINGRINPCYSGLKEFDLSKDELIYAYDKIIDHVLAKGYTWSPIYDMWNSLIGNKSVVCIFTGCDIFHTHSAEVVLGDGTITNCMRTSAKDLFIRYPVESKIRDEVLSKVSQENGGCEKCEYWFACHGGCPTTALDNDWRNRTTFCELFKFIFKKLSLIQKSFSVKKLDKEQPKKGDIQCATGEHTDGIEHIDGDVRHLDSGRSV
jgi:uncharacterized protein